jgi:hypothetical protein
MASETGFLNPNTCTWNEQVFKAAGIDEGKLSPPASERECLTG